MYSKCCKTNLHFCLVHQLVSLAVDITFNKKGLVNIKVASSNTTKVIHWHRVLNSGLKLRRTENGCYQVIQVGFKVINDLIIKSYTLTDFFLINIREGKDVKQKHKNNQLVHLSN